MISNETKSNLQLVLLDEATASMDEQTDALVQETLFRELEGRTLLTIAHRLDTILDYDRILVLDQGRVKVGIISAIF